MASEAAKRATAALLERRKADGWRKVTAWLDPPSAAALDVQKAAAGSVDEAIRRALKGVGAGSEPAPPKSAKPPRARVVAKASPDEVAAVLKVVRTWKAHPKPGKR